jgi:hypothetical protein
MEDDIYASDNRSSLELIEQDFVRSQNRSYQRRGQKSNRLLHVSNILPAMAIATLIVAFLGLLATLWPVL